MFNSCDYMFKPENLNSELVVKLHLLALSSEWNRRNPSPALAVISKSEPALLKVHDQTLPTRWNTNLEYRNSSRETSSIFYFQKSERLPSNIDPAEYAVCTFHCTDFPNFYLLRAGLENVGLV